MPQDQLANDQIQRFQGMKANRAVLESHLQEIRDLILPLAAAFTGSDTAGSKNRDQILDNSAESASELLSAGLNGFLTNPGTKWAGLRIAGRDESEEEAEWLELAMEIHFLVFESPETQFTTQLGQVYQELVDFCTSVEYVAARPGRMPLYQAQTLSECFIAESHEGVVDTVFRIFALTARQAKQRWGNKAGEKVLKAVEQNTTEQPFPFLHAVSPREESRRDSILARDLPIASTWISMQDKSTIQEGGFHEMPYIVGRWNKRSGEVYGRGPGMKALADVKMLQRAMEATILGAERTIKPALQIADDGVLGDVNLAAGALNFVRAEVLGGRGDVIKPILQGLRADLGEEFMQGIRLRIERAYFNHLLQLSRDPRMTATQVLKLDEEALRVLGPFLGRIQNELLGRLIERTFGILLRGGLLPPAPASLQGESLEVEYVSPIAKAQRLSEVSALSQLIEVTAPLINLDGGLLDNLDSDRAFRHAADRLGVPHALLRDPRKVEELRAARRAAAEEQAQAQRAQELAGAAQSAGQAAAAFSGAGIDPAELVEQLEAA